jgi:hypothetical protein
MTTSHALHRESTSSMSLVTGGRLDRVDFDLHGAVGIRLLDATPGDARAVERQLGPLKKRLDREPDIVIRFVDDLRLTSPVRLLGVDEAGFTEDAFLVMRSKHSSKTRVKIPFDRVGGRCEIVCESGVPAVPHLIAILNLTALERNLVPLHASAFNHRGAGVLVTGWSKGGKTEALLAFMAEGAEYIGDEWIYLDPDGRMYGIPQPVRLWSWHLAQYPAYRERIGRAHRARLSAIQASIGLAGTMAGKKPRSAPARVMRRVQAVLERQAHVDADPDQLFGPGRSLSGRLDHIFLVGTREGDGVVAEPIRPEEIADRMVHSVRYELERFIHYYLMFKFAFPGAVNPRIEGVDDVLGIALRNVLRGRPAHVVHHPYPMPIAALYETMSPLVRPR